ncbi:hypothetical protein V1477_020534 [Vespula maculifrons]|uniref:Uncharacterized protein n=1 Tax=Vespula maculifrons TaxID=7453 RepID=A0ABD2AM87_VESMC
MILIISFIFLFQNLVVNPRIAMK